MSPFDQSAPRRRLSLGRTDPAISESELWLEWLKRAANHTLPQILQLIAERRDRDYRPDEFVVHTPRDHPGAAAIDADVIADEILQGYFSGSRAIYHGEERPAGPVIWKPGRIVLESDPIDGSALLGATSTGFAIVLSAWKMTSDGLLRHLCGIILRADWTSVSWSLPEAKVVIRVPEIRGRGHRYVLHRGDIVAGDPHILACVAAGPDQHGKLDMFDPAIRHERRLYVFNAAGTPVTAHMLLDGLAGIYEPKASKVWDALGLIPLTIAGGSVFDLDGRPRQVIEEMERITDLNTRKIDPYIAISHPAALQNILDATTGTGLNAAA